jgi:hypothetical protein
MDLRDGIDLETAAETVFAVGSPEVYRLLTVDSWLERLPVSGTGTPTRSPVSCCRPLTRAP